LLPEAVLVAPRVGAGCEVVLEVDAGASLVPGLLNKLGVVPEVEVVPDAGAAELPPPRLGNRDELDDAVVVAAPLVAAVLVGAAGLPQLKPPPVEAPAPENKLLVGPAEEVGAAMFPPKVEDGAALDAGWEEAGCVAGVVLRLNPRGFAGVDEGVVLPRPPKRPPAGFAACAFCAPGVVAWFAPPKRFVVGVEVGAAFLFASVEAPVFPPKLKSEPVLELPRGFAADWPEVAPLNRLGVEEEVVAGFALPNKEEPVCAPPLAWLF
jgi:hypothetical protein